MIDDARAEMKLAQKWRQLTNYLPSFRPIPPSGMLFPKEKSREWEALLKMHLVISYFKHPSANEGHLVGRYPSVVISALSDTPDHLKTWNMQGCRDIFRRASDAFAQDTHEWCWAELDMVNIYTEIPTEHVHEAVTYGIQRIQTRTRSRQAIKRFALSRGGKSEDRFGSAASAYFVNVPLPLVYEYITYELTRNGLFRVGSWILSQVKRLPMGGPNSAQLACIYMACCEVKNTAVAPFPPLAIACRYRDILHFFARRCTLIAALPAFRDTLREYYNVPIQFEHMVATLQGLEVSVCVHPKQDVHIRLLSKVLSVENITRSNVQRWPDPWTPNSTAVLHSLCMGLAAKCCFWARKLGDQSTNILTVLSELGAKEVRTTLWLSRFVAFWQHRGCPMICAFVLQCLALGAKIQALAML